MVKNNNKVLYTILVFLVLSLLVGTFGLVGKKIDLLHEKSNDPNPEHKLYLNGKLYFYQKDNLIGTYECKNTVYCGYAYEYDDDAGLTFKNYSDDKVDVVTLVNNRYAFIVDTDLKEEYYRGSDILIYDVRKKEVINTISGVKNYTLGLTDNILFIQDKKTKLFQIADFSGTEVKYKTEPIYQYLGVNKTLVDNLLDSSNIASYDGKKWTIINQDGTNKSVTFDRSLIDYNGKYAILRNMNGYTLVTYQNEPLLDGSVFDAFRFVGKYAAVNYNDEFYIVDYEKNKVVSKKYSMDIDKTYTEKLNKNGEVEIYLDNEIVETVK